MIQEHHQLMGFIAPHAQKAVTNQSQVRARAFRVLLVATAQTQAVSMEMLLYALLAHSVLEAPRLAPHAQKAATNLSQVRARAFRVLLVATNQSQVRARALRVLQALPRFSLDKTFATFALLEPMQHRMSHVLSAQSTPIIQIPVLLQNQHV